VKVAYIGPLTGALAASGRGGLNGAKAGIAYLNNGGGEAGVKYDLTVGDDGGDPAKTAAIVRQLAGQGVTMVMPTATPGADVATQPFVTQAHMLYVSPATAGLAGGMTATGKFPWAFGSGPSLAQFSLKQVQYAANVLHVKNLGEIYSADPGGKEFATSAGVYAKQLGITTVSQSFPPTEQDVTAQLTKLKNDGAQALAIWTYGTPLVTVAEDLSKLGWHPPIVTDLGSADPAVVGLLKKVAPDVLTNMAGGPMASTYITQTRGALPTTALGKAFVQNMRKLLGRPLNGNDLVGVYSFDALIALDRGIKLAGAIDTTKIAHVFSTQPIQISQGTTPWPTDRGGGVPSSQLGLLQSNSNFSNGTGLAPQATK
jgi:branched-chain amino acid transport system substrate-binding protein